MAEDTVRQIYHTHPLRPASPHPQYVQAKREKGEKRKGEDRDDMQKKAKDRVTISASSTTKEEDTPKVTTTDSEPTKHQKIDIRI